MILASAPLDHNSLCCRRGHHSRIAARHRSNSIKKIVTMTSVTTINTFGDYYMNVDDGSNTNRAVARFNKAMDTTMTTNQQNL